MHTTTRRRTSQIGLLAALMTLLSVFTLVGRASPAGADTTSNTDDKSVGVPTAWWTYANVTESFINGRLAANAARLTDVEIAGSTTFNVTMVRNAGAYAVPGWEWYFGKSFAEVGSLLSANTGRLIELKPYTVSGVTQFALIMVKNTGATARAWHYGAGLSPAQVATTLSATGDRLIDLQPYTEGGVKKVAFVSIANTGADAKPWQYWFDQTPASMASHVSSFGGRITNLVRQADGTYDFIQVKNAGGDNFQWWYFFGFSSMTAAANRAAQFGARITNAQMHIVFNGRAFVPSYDVVMIENSNAATQRIRGLLYSRFVDSTGAPTATFAAYVKRVSGPVFVDLNSAADVDPASAVKIIHNLTAQQKLQSGPDTTRSAFTYYNYPSQPDPTGNPKDVCPDAAEETAANLQSTTEGNALTQMMLVSDNRMTRGVELRYGHATINTTAAAAGMSSTSIQQIVGCAYQGGIRNHSTARDLATIYESIDKNTVLLDAANRDALYARMCCNNGSLTQLYRDVVNQEAAKQGKSAIATQFADLMVYRAKGGTYNGLACPAGSLSTCVYEETESSAGHLTIPGKVAGNVVMRDDVFAIYHADTQITCSATCGQAQEVSAAQAYVTASVEMFREEIASALLTW